MTFREALCLLWVGFVKQQLADYAGALEIYETCLPIWRELGDRAGEGTTLGDIGGVYTHLGQYEEALWYLQQALDIPYNPLFSALHLAPGNKYDGRLEVYEVYGLDLTSADLVGLVCVIRRRR